MSELDDAIALWGAEVALVRESRYRLGLYDAMKIAGASNRPKEIPGPRFFGKRAFRKGVSAGIRAASDNIYNEYLRRLND